MGGAVRIILVRGGGAVRGKMARAELSVPEGGGESLPGRGSGGAAAGRVRGAGRAPCAAAVRAGRAPLLSRGSSAVLRGKNVRGGPRGAAAALLHCGREGGGVGGSASECNLLQELSRLCLKAGFS